jgi:hypothetical protein
MRLRVGSGLEFFPTKVKTLLELHDVFMVDELRLFNDDNGIFDDFAQINKAPKRRTAHWPHDVDRCCLFGGKVRVCHVAIVLGDQENTSARGEREALFDNSVEMLS